ncbi:MAG TPA: hypothetical protein VIQ22_06765, partial [Gammaproteobacteria bacterium]
RPPSLPMSAAKRELSPAMLSYLTESRRMDNSKLLRDFKLTLRFPDLTAGLQALDGAAELAAYQRQQTP